MEGLGSYIFRILCCVVVCGIGLSLFPNGRMKSMIRLFAGVFVTIMILQPGVDLELPDLERWIAEFRQQGQLASAAGEGYARQQKYQFIKDGLEAYILDKAASLDCSLMVQVVLDGEGYPTGVVLSGSLPEESRRELEIFLWEELGIAKEDQQWNGQQIPPPLEDG